MFCVGIEVFRNNVTVTIKKDKNYLRYIQIIRKYDNSLSMEQMGKRSV